MDAITSAIGTKEGARWLAIGRNLGSYVIAADVLGVRSGPIYEWLAGFLTRTLTANNTDEQVVADNWSSGSNASAQMGFVTAALCVYTNESTRLASSWEGYRRYCAIVRALVEASNSDVWQLVPSDPVGIQDKGAAKTGCRLDGAIGNDMSRGGDDVCSPTWTQNSWVGLEGAVPAALVFARAGYPAWEVADAAIRRALDDPWFLRQTTGNSDWFGMYLLERVRVPGQPGLRNDLPVFHGRSRAAGRSASPTGLTRLEAPLSAAPGAVGADVASLTLPSCPMPRSRLPGHDGGPMALRSRARESPRRTVGTRVGGTARSRGIQRGRRGANWRRLLAPGSCCANSVLADNQEKRDAHHCAEKGREADDAGVRGHLQGGAAASSFAPEVLQSEAVRGAARDVGQSRRLGRPR